MLLELKATVEWTWSTCVRLRGRLQVYSLLLELYKILFSINFIWFGLYVMG